MVLSAINRHFAHVRYKDERPNICLCRTSALYSLNYQHLPDTASFSHRPVRTTVTYLPSSCLRSMNRKLIPNPCHSKSIAAIGLLRLTPLFALEQRFRFAVRQRTYVWKLPRDNSSSVSFTSCTTMWMELCEECNHVTLTP